MKKKELIEKEVERTLNSFGELRKPEANPFFDTRLDARLNEITSPVSHKRFSFGGLRLQTAILTVIVLLNVFTSVAYLTKTETTELSTDDLLTAYSEEYSWIDEELNSLNNN